MLLAGMADAFATVGIEGSTIEVREMRRHKAQAGDRILQIAASELCNPTKCFIN